MQLKCLRCNTDMKFIGNEKIQLGQTSWITGDIPNLFAGSMAVAVYVCPKCSKIEFFQTNEESVAGISKIKCPNCGQTHDMDYPKCPFCKHSYI